MIIEPGRNLRKVKLFVSSFVVLLVCCVHAQAQKTHNIKIDSQCNIFAAGVPQVPEMSGGAGILPVKVQLSGASAVMLSNVTGKVSCAFSFYGAEGGDCAGGDTILDAFGGISGIVHHKRTMFVVGVFLGDAPPDTAPDRLDFTNRDHLSELAPQLGQVFLVGDGLNRARKQKQFIVPGGATAFYLGFADGSSFQGEPGFYDDNKGTISAVVTLINKEASVNAGAYAGSTGVGRVNETVGGRNQGAGAKPVAKLELDTDRPGADYKWFDIAEANPDVCRVACEKDSQCQAFTYTKPGVQGDKAKCYLKSQVPPIYKSDCCVSGVKQE
jgi:hypothetical protein